MKVELSSQGVRVWISVSFVLLAIALELTMGRYWSSILEPRLKSQAQSNAQLLAQSQAIALANVISRENLTDESAKQELQSVFDHLLLIKDPALNQHFFVSISLEVDYDVVPLTPGELNLSQGDRKCSSCFEAPVELYSRESDELLGIATFLVSDVFFKNLKNELKDRFVIEGVIVFGLLLLLWVVVIILVRNLYNQIEQRKKTHEALIVAKEQAESANEARGQFLANMSHEIRTPMNAIIGLCYIVLKTELSAFQRNHLAKVHGSARSLLTLINDILDFSKIESGKFEIEKIDFDMDDVLENLAQMILPKTSEKELDILYAVDASVPYQLKGDPFRLGQILLNLINNAIKFTEEGEIVVSISAETQKYADKITLLFSVKDTGVGIEEHSMSKLFSSFTQADSSMSRKYGGTGLGLAICKNLVEMMDGRIWVESQLNVGSTFYFTAVFGLNPPENFNRFIMPEEISGIHVLVVDDNHTSLAVYSQMMTSFNFQVSQANSAEQAIALIEQHSTHSPFELILMDWKMPNIDGIQAAEIIKTNTKLEKIPSIILISASAEEDVFIEAQYFLDAFLLKPVCQSTLYDCIVGIFCQVPRKSYANFSNESVRSKVTSDFRGKKVLLVEDNKTNREVAINLLNEVQLIVDIAINGKEAVEKIQLDQYDLILMDVQMPQMDGITATKIIREQHNQKIPIIAMTAHAMQGDKDRCLAAGMNDYLTKPIDVEHFYQTLEKWLPIDCHSIATVNVGAANQQDSDIEISLQYSGIDIQSALKRLLGNRSLLLRLIANFDVNNRNKMQELEAAIGSSKWDEARQIAHSIKGESGNIAANEVFVLAGKLESALEMQSKDSQALFKQLKVQIEVVFLSSTAAKKDLEKLDTHIFFEDTQPKVDLVNNQLNDISAHAVVSLKADISKVLVEATDYLTKNNLKASKTVGQLGLLLSSAEYEYELAQLNVCMSTLDFKAALQQIRLLSDKLKENGII